MGKIRNSKKKTILIVDAAGRCSILAERYAQSPKVGRVLAVPGNDLLSLNCKKPLKTFPNIATTSVKEIIDICRKEKVDLIDVNQDNAVAAGVTDELLQNGFVVAG